MSILTSVNMLRFNLRIDILNSIKAPWDDDDDATTLERFTLSNFLNAYEMSTKWKPIVSARCVSSRQACSHIVSLRRRHHCRRDLKFCSLIITIQPLQSLDYFILCPWQVSYKSHSESSAIDLDTTSISLSHRFTCLSSHLQILFGWDSDRPVLLARARHRLPWSQAR